ncbi:UNVERIFIED_CONTAM: hypothetical protein Sindi_2493800 [Sesamum indicum]
MEGTSRANMHTLEDMLRQVEPMVQFTREELQKLMKEAGRIVVYERRTTTLLGKETTKRQLFRDRDIKRTLENASRREPEKGREPASSKVGSSSRERVKRRELAISRVEVDSVGRKIELLGKQIDELKKRGELVAHNRNSTFNNKILMQVVNSNFRMPDIPKYDGTKDP